MRIMRIISALRRGVAAAAASLLLAACGYLGGSHPAAAGHPGQKSGAPQPMDPAAQALAAMVDAVGPSTAHAPVDLRFSIHKRPQIGQDDEIDYALVPRVAGLQKIRIAFGSFAGLQVVSHGPDLAAIKPASDVPIFGSVTVRPTKEGLFTLTAAVAVETPTESVVWPFSIPIIAGEGPAQTAANHP